MIRIPTVSSHLCRRRPYIGANKERLADKDRVGRIVVIGSSGSGKTRLVDGLRETSLVKKGIIEVPRRVITRAPRDEELSGSKENIYVSKQEFQQLVEQGEIDIHWNRNLGDKLVRYGFLRASDKAKLTVYSANNALYHSRKQAQILPHLEDAIFFDVFAPLQTRRQRILKRSPSMSPRELESRLADHTFYPGVGNLAEVDFVPCVGNSFPYSSDYDQGPRFFEHEIVDLRHQADLRIHNFGCFETAAPNSFNYFICSLVEIQNPSLLGVEGEDYEFCDKKAA